MLKMLKAEDEKSSEEIVKELNLRTHKSINNKYSGTVINLKDEFAEVHLEIIANMIADDMGLIHNGFLHSSANLTAVMAVNEKYGFTIGSVSHFLAPVREGDTVIFKAKSRQNIGRKRVVDVIGRVDCVKVFIGEFTVIIMDKHILKVELTEIDVSEYDDDNDLHES